MQLSRTTLKKISNRWNPGHPAEIYIKDESENPLGTIKDRRNFYIIQEASRLQVDKLVLITSGNNGYSLCKIAQGTSIKIVCVISKDLSEETKAILKNVAYQVIELNLNHKILRPEELISFARESDDEVIWDVTNGYEEHYALVLREILEEVKPTHIVVPVGSGGIFVSFAEELDKNNLQIKLIGIGVQNTIHSMADKLSTPWTPYTKAMEVYQRKGHSILRLSEEEVRDSYKIFKNVIVCEPSSCVVLAALSKLKFKKDDKVVFLNTGKIKIVSLQD